jgi:hypothetical protein
MVDHSINRLLISVIRRTRQWVQDTLGHFFERRSLASPGDNAGVGAAQALHAGAEAGDSGLPDGFTR